MKRIAILLALYLSCLCTHPSVAVELTSFSSEDSTLGVSSNGTNPPEANASLSEPESEEPQGAIADPLEPLNRVFFQVNDRLYFWVFRPVGIGYKAITSQEIRTGIHNFFVNLSTPIRLANCLFQGKLKNAGNEAVRFLLNSTLGMAGFLDPAKKELKIEKTDADLGQTFGLWGVGPALYLHWPIIGPSNLRDTAGYVGDLFLDPRTYLLGHKFLATGMGQWGLDKINETSLSLGQYEALKKAALDPYVAVREAYAQNRENKIKRRQ